MPSHTQKFGFSTLIMVLVITTVMVVIAISTTTTGIDLNQIGFQQTEAIETQANLEGCVEEALLKLNGDNSYSGEVLSLGSSQCTITVSGAGSQRTITVNANNNGQFYRTSTVEVDLTSGLAITSWQDA